MKVIMLALLLPFLMLLSSCSCTPEVKYIDRVEYIEPQVPVVMDTLYPSTRLQVWGDYAIYKKQCEAQIDKCNIDKNSIIESLRTEEVGNGQIK